jgi:hypothetical protein
MEESKVLYYLDIWRDYMRYSGDAKLGYPSKSAGFLSGGIHSFEDWGDEHDVSVARTVDKAIDDLPDLQVEAINAVWLGIKTKIVPDILAVLYENALSKLAVKLTERNLY